jgi:hypothetical protein
MQTSPPVDRVLLVAGLVVGIIPNPNRIPTGPRNCGMAGVSLLFHAENLPVLLLLASLYIGLGTPRLATSRMCGSPTRFAS